MASFNDRLTNFGSNDPFTGCQLVPFGGNLLTINGSDYDVPWGITNTTGGIQVNYNNNSTYTIDKAPGMLQANTLYYVYAYINGCTMAIDFSTTGWTIANPGGYEVKASDATCTLVGMIYTFDVSGQIVTRGGARQQTCISRHNQIIWEVLAWPSGNSSAPLSDNQVQWLQWSDRLTGNAVFKAACQNTKAGDSVALAAAINGGGSFTPAVTSPANNAKLFTQAVGYNPGAEGLLTAVATLTNGEETGVSTSTVNSGLLAVEGVLV